MKGWLKGRKDDGQVNERMEKGWLKGRKDDCKEERITERKKGWLKGRKGDRQDKWKDGLTSNARRNE